MPVDRGTVGMGARRQGRTEPGREDDRNRQLERDLDEAAARDAADERHTRGRQPGAHGDDTPHRNLKPGTRSALSDAADRTE